MKIRKKTVRFPLYSWQGLILLLKKQFIVATMTITSVAAGIGAANAGDLPDPVLTPGALNPAVNQDNIANTVCVKGYTKTIRPSAYMTNALKKKQIRQYGYADTNPRHYEEDHLIALSIGGAPDDPHNLWPEPRNSAWGADKKDQLEWVMYKMVCSRQLSLREAQHAMAENWIAAWKRYVVDRRGYRFSNVD